MSLESAAAFYERVQNDEAFQEQIKTLKDPDVIERYVKDELSYDFTREEMQQVIFERNPEMTDEELEAVVGGLGVGDWIAMGIAGGSVAITLVLTGAAFAVAAA